jgi:hypothetical protein
MSDVILRNKTEDGKSLVATFCPDRGMNLMSYRCDDLEIIDQSTKGLFEERYAGLGALIGPHFHRRPTAIIPPVKNEELFPHIATLRKKGIEEPFSHGIARYAPWKVEADATSLRASLKGEDEWNGVSLKELEGQDFKMEFFAELDCRQLKLRLQVRSDTDSLVGIHYYYRLPSERSFVEGQVAPKYMDQGESKQIPSSWNQGGPGGLAFCLEQEADFNFHPASNRPLESEILLKTSDYQLRTRYRCVNQENSWQLYHPKGSSYVCIEPMSALNPRKPRLSVSGLELDLAILERQGEVN